MEAFYMFLMLGITFGLIESIPKNSDPDFQRHIIYFAPKTGDGKLLTGGCRTKPIERLALLGTARACPAKKPIKLTKALKMGKHLCATDWQVCAISDKAVQMLSWKRTKMPPGCFAFNYGKNKAAGYGNHCQANHFFDGVLCCPKPGTKASHILNVSTLYIHGKLADQGLNLIE